MFEEREEIKNQQSKVKNGMSRRRLLRGLSSATVLPVAVEAQHEHHAPQAEKKAPVGPYKPKCFNAHEYRTLTKLADLIIPADEQSSGAVAGGAPEYIDLLASGNDELAAIFTGGLALLDRESERRNGAKFAEAKPERQTALLDLIAYRKNDSPDLGPGIRFFEWARKLTVDAYYTSKAGIADLGYKGNVGMTEFKVPEEAVKLALERSGLR
jgi:hypothetical protein